MANIDVTNYNKASVVSNNEVGRGWTHVARIDYQDFVKNPSATDGDTLTFPVIGIPANSIVESVGYRLVTAFNDPAGVGGSSLTVQLGDTGDADGYVTAKELHLDGTEVFIGANDGAYFTVDSGTHAGKRAQGKTYTSADTIEALFTPTSFKLDEETAGEIVIFARIVSTDILV
jgi:hypothetical protein